MRVRRTVSGAGAVGVSAFALLLWAAPALAAPEAPVTKPATAVTGSTATFNGELNPNATAKAGWYFAYNLGVGCTGGATTAQETEVEGNALPEKAEVAGLEPSRLYSFCMVATNELAESTFGNTMALTTQALAPAIDGQGVSGVTPFEAQLEGLVNANNQATTCTFQYGETTAYGKEGACALASPESFGDQTVSVAVTALQPKTTYHFRIVAENAAKEKTENPDGEFTTLTPEKPIIDSEGLSALSATGATLEAQINPNYQETSYAFQYATDEALTGATTVPGASNLSAGFGDQLASVSLSGLAPRTTYYYRTVAENETSKQEGTPAEGKVEHLTTLATPLVTLEEPQGVTRTAAALTGTVNPGGVETTYHFAYVAAGEYEPLASNPYANGRTTLQSTSVGADYAAHATGPVSIQELTAGITYDYALVATNELGTTTSTDGTFTTSSPTPPIVETGGASNVTQYSASVAGTVDGQGLQSTYALELGTGAGGYGPPLQLGSLAAGEGARAITFSLGGLLPETTYHYRITATNTDGTRDGQDATLTTASTNSSFATPSLPLLAVPPIAFPSEQAATGATRVKPLTNAQKLAKALKACHKQRSRRKRANCERQARHRYAPTKRKGKR